MLSKFIQLLRKSAGFTGSAVLHGALFALLFLPLGHPGGGRKTPEEPRSHYVPVAFWPAKPPHGPSCDVGPCVDGPPKPAPRPDIPAPPGEELAFVDDGARELLPALRRAGGWVAIVSRAERGRALAFRRASDGLDQGPGVRLALYPIRLVVQEPEVYPEITTWVAAVPAAAGDLRAIAVFPSDTQERLHAAIEAAALRAGLRPGARRAILAVTSTEPLGIEVRSVELRPSQAAGVHRSQDGK